MPGTPHRPAEHPVSSRIIDKGFFYRIPLKFLSQPDGYISLVANRI
jgi:hypothetical protein